MLIPTKGKAMELLYRAIPYPEQIRNIDLDKEKTIYFDWRSVRYKLYLEYCRVERVNGHFLEGDGCSILMTQCLRTQLWTILD